MHKTPKTIMLMALTTFLVAYIFFNSLQINDENKVTGAVVNEPQAVFIPQLPEESLGKYSIKPSFNQKLDFDVFDDYRKIADKAKQLKTICKASSDIESCVNSNKNIFDADGLSMSSNCESQAKQLLLYFADNAYLCSKSGDDNCICKFTLFVGDYSSIDIEKDKVSMIKGDEKLFEQNLDINYEGSNKFEAGKDILLLKTGDTIKAYDKDDLPHCTIKRNVFRFCVKSNKQVYAYSEEDKQTKLRDIQYKFAIKFD